MDKLYRIGQIQKKTEEEVHLEEAKVAALESTNK